jgi:hypothetical protein
MADEFADTGEAASPQPPGCQVPEPSFDEVEPRRGSRGEMKLEPGMLLQPLLDFRMVVGAVVVENHVDRLGPADLAG